MTVDAKETEVPSTPASPSAPATPEVVTTPAVPPEGKSGDTPTAPPAVSAETPAPTPKVVDEAGDELTPEEQDVMARLTGQKTEEKKTTETPVVSDTPAAPPVETPPVETVEEVGGIKLPSSHELAGYKPETRKRIEQFTAKLKETAGPATAFTSLVDGFRAVGVTPEQFHAWQDLGLDLRSKDPAVRQAAITGLHQLALKTGLKVDAPEPDNSAVIAKITELEKSLDLDPAHAEALRGALKAKAPAPKAPEAAPPAREQAPDPRQLVQQAVFAERLERAKYEAQTSLAEVAAQLPAAEHQTFQADVYAEVAKIEAGLSPEARDNTLQWGARMRTAAKNVLSRRQAPASQTRPVTQSLRPTTPNPSQSDDPQPGTEEYELGILTGKIPVKR